MPAPRRNELAETAQRQISELIMFLSTTDEVLLRHPCHGREKLGDGTTGAVAWHIADRYERIAAFVSSAGTTPSSHAISERSGQHAPGAPEHCTHGPSHKDSPAADDV